MTQILVYVLTVDKSMLSLKITVQLPAYALGFC